MVPQMSAERSGLASGAVLIANLTGVLRGVVARISAQPDVRVEPVIDERFDLLLSDTNKRFDLLDMRLQVLGMELDRQFDQAEAEIRDLGSAPES